MIRRIRFKGDDYVLVGDDEDGAIATPEAYQAGEASFAHLFGDGRVRRFGQDIGSRADIEFLEEVALSPDDVDEALANIVFHPSWRARWLR